MNVVKPDKHRYGTNTIPEIILRWILSNIKRTPEHLGKEIKKHIKY